MFQIDYNGIEQDDTAQRETAVAVTHNVGIVLKAVCKDVQLIPIFYPNFSRFVFVGDELLQKRSWAFLRQTAPAIKPVLQLFYMRSNVFGSRRKILFQKVEHIIAFALGSSSLLIADDVADEPEISVIRLAISPPVQLSAVASVKPY